MVTRNWWRSSAATISARAVQDADFKACWIASDRFHRPGLLRALRDFGNCSYEHKQHDDALPAGRAGRVGSDPAGGFRAFPPRLPEQPIFYPVLTEAYAVKIARDWNVPVSGAGYVTRFAVLTSFLGAYEVRDAGGSEHQGILDSGRRFAGVQPSYRWLDRGQRGVFKFRGGHTVCRKAQVIDAEAVILRPAMVKCHTVDRLNFAPDRHLRAERKELCLLTQVGFSSIFVPLA
jgi:hypothetical protein